MDLVYFGYQSLVNSCPYRESRSRRWRRWQRRRVADHVRRGRPPRAARPRVHALPPDAEDGAHQLQPRDQVALGRHLCCLSPGILMQEWPFVLSAARPLSAAFLRGLQGFRGTPLALAALPRLRCALLPIGYSEKALHVKGRRLYSLLENATCATLASKRRSSSQRMR